MTHRYLGPFDNNGMQYMSNYQAANGLQYYPLVLFELNSCNNIANGAIVTHAPVRQMYQNVSTIQWQPLNGHETDGTTLSSVWQTETSSHASSTVGAVPLDQAIHKWSSLDLELWGTKNKPTKYHIALVQFSEDVLPDWGNRTDQSAEFWQSMVKHYVYNPLAKIDDGYNRRKMKILQQYTYNIDPTASYENDTDPHVKTVKLFYKFNRQSNFSWMYNTPAVQTIPDMNQADWRAERQQNQPQVHPNARIYVMVRASNFTKVTEGVGTIDNTTTPSISWRMKTCYMINN